MGRRWTLERALGTGATAAVYHARDTGGQQAAVKVLLPHMAEHDVVQRRFIQEARIVGKLTHPAIVRILDQNVDASTDAYIAFEYLEGETLAALAERAPVPLELLLDVADQILDALNAAHAQGVVHRDLKPSNVFVTTTGKVKILDFGVARTTASDATAIGTEFGMAVGTTAYMAPEQALGRHDDVDGRSDLFSLGAMLFRLLSGEPVHPARTPTEALQLTATLPARSLKTVAPELPDDLVAMVDMSLAFAQSARYQDARSMQQDLRACMTGAPSSVARQTQERRQQPTLVPLDTPAHSAAAVAPTLMASEAGTAPPAEPEPNARTEFEAPPSSGYGEAEKLIGRTLADRYRVDALLGTGGMGAVYRAEHVHMKKFVALKVLHQVMTALPEVVARFEREAVAAARIEHPHVAGAKDFGKLDDGSFYLALEYVQGTSLRQLLRQSGPPVPERARTIVQQIAQALGAAHRLGIVHRDLKPENIMLMERADRADFVKVLDFGIAKLTRGETSREPQLTQLGTVFGTPEYMSPEQAMGNPVDAKSDVYSLGIILYELLAGRTPFAREGMMAVLTAHMTEQPAPLPNSVPPDLAALTVELLDKQPERRPSAEALGARLAGVPRAAATSPVVKPAWQSRREAARQQWQRMREAAQARWQRWAPPLERRMHRAGLKLPLWLVLAVALSSLLMGVLLVAALGGDSEDPPAMTKVGATLARVIAGDEPRVAPTADVPEDVRREVARIEALPVYKRSADDWLTLARGTSAMGRYKDSTLAYQAVLSLKPSMRDDPELLGHLKRAAHDPDSFNLVVNLCATRLKQPGIDVLWTLWQEFRQDEARAEQAEFLQKRLVVLSRRASRELRTAIELATTESCGKLMGAVERATKYSDQRALDSLKRLKSTSGCGPDRSEDCYACLRHDDALERALARAERQPGPGRD